MATWKVVIECGIITSGNEGVVMPQEFFNLATRTALMGKRDSCGHSFITTLTGGSLLLEVDNG